MPAHDFTRITPNVYHDLHVSWISAMKSALNNGILPRPYFAIAEQHNVHDKKRSSPDIQAMTISESPAPYGIDALKLAEPMSPPQASIVAHSQEYSIHTSRRTIAIRSEEDRRIVAILELLSYSNKRSRRELSKFMRKVTTAFGKGIHVSIVDPYSPNRLAPRGIHGAIWDELGEVPSSWSEDKPFTTAAYSVDEGISAYVQPYALGELIPDLPLFLKPDFYVYVPLEKTYMEALHTMGWHYREVLEAKAFDAK